MRPKLVVTLPPSAPPDFAHQAASRGAELLELRTDLIDPSTDLEPLRKHLPLLVAERSGIPAPSEWWRRAAVRDSELGSIREGTNLVSHHSSRSLSTDDALAIWAGTRATHVKHVEPLGDPEQIFDTQRRLQSKFREVTVLVTGELALPFRAALSERNACDYVALSDAFRAAPGQRLLVDAARANRAGGARRLGIIGTRISGSRSPRIHPPPFERIDLPEDAPISNLLPQLLPHYAGFAITSPFKRVVAQAVNASVPSVNTLVRRGTRWRGFNTDVAGAAEVLRRLRSLAVTVLGNGGAADAIAIAAREQNVRIQLVQRSNAGTITGAAIWTWPPHLPPPPDLRFSGHPVAVIAYGASARTIARQITQRGGTPLLLGPAWFVAQARLQRELWESAT